jgi:SAM-dependent methyltransferase
LFAQLIAARGCAVAGFDASEALLSIARRRTPSARFDGGDMERLPYADEQFDVVTAINSFQYAADPHHALLEARRVAKRGAQIIVATWGPPDACEAAAILKALSSLVPPPPPGAPGPFALSDQAALQGYLASAGFTPGPTHDVDVVWQFESLEAALTASLAAGPAIRAIQAGGRDTVRAAVERAIAPYQLSSGGYRLENRFRFIVAGRD